MRKRFDFDRVVAKMQRAKIDLPVKLANQAQNFFSSSWRKQGWEDGRLTAWKPRLQEGRRNKGGQILVQSGALKRAVGSSIRSQTFDLVRLAVALPYAEVHNEGFDGMVKRKDGSTYRLHMPKRQFMGDSKTLRNQQITLINKSINKAWQA